MSTVSGLPLIMDFSSIARENNPHQIAVGNGIEGATWTWSEFDDASLRAARAIREVTAQGDRVAFLCESSAEHIILWNGAIKAGCVVSNLHTRASQHTLEFCLEKLKPHILVIDPTHAEFVNEHICGNQLFGIECVVTIGKSETSNGRSMAAFLDGHEPHAPDVKRDGSDVISVQ